MASMQWWALDGRMLFEFAVNREPTDGVPSLATVSCKSSPRERRQLTVTSRPSHFKVRFPCGCYAHGWLRQQTPVHIDGVVNTAVFADIHYGCNPDEDHHFEGIMVACPARGPLPPPGPPAPVPPAPAPPEQPVEPLPVVGGAAEELFPYVYVRQWPKVAAQDLLWGFIQYAGSSPPASSFFDDLVAARNTGRAAAQALALRYVDGGAPYQGDFIGSVALVQGPVAGFAALAGQLLRPGADPVHWRAQAVQHLCELLKAWGEDWSYWSGSAYAQALDSIWQSYFALIVLLGYDPALLEDFVRTLMLAHAIEVALLPAVGNAQAPVDTPLPALTAQQLAALANATVVLPPQVFPLPPAAGAQQSPPPDPRGWIEPYAIGELQMVRQRLLRYQAGEIARIENVMRGERREVANRRTHRQVDELKQTSGEMQELRNDAADERSSLQEQARQAVAEATVTNQYSNFTTSYGPPTQATLDGSWSQVLQPGATPGVEDAVRFARDVLNRTVNRISRSVSVLRASSTMSQTEESVCSVIDNTAGQRNLRAVLRWLDKVYEACVVNYGQRLMIEFMVWRPAAAYIAQEQALSGQDYLRPIPPRRLGITTFEDVQPRNYARLGALYGVTELRPPPLAQRFACATLRGGQEKLLAIPEGYCATSATVSCAGAPVPVVVVGRQTFAPGGPVSAPMGGEDGTVPVSVSDSAPAMSPPSDAQALVNVEVACIPSQRAMDEWRICVYASLMQAYDRQLAAYRGQSGGARLVQPRSPLASRQIEQRELKNACMRLLLDRMASLTGGDAAASPPSAAQVDEPRYLQFFDQVLEWNEMAYSFHANLGPGDGIDVGTLAGGEDASFASFLQAQQARVLLPVQPRHVMAFLYFFSSGMLWIGSDRLAPADPGDVALINDLKHAALDRAAKRTVGPRWEVVVPTSMQVLDDTDTLGPRWVPAAQPPEGEEA